MKANEMGRDELERFVETDGGKALMQRLDASWDCVMQAAVNAGFIVQAYGGTCTLATYEAMHSECGAEGVARMLKMNGVELGEVRQ